MTDRKQKVNILVVGPGNSGKTTFLETLSMTPLVEVDYTCSGEIVENNSGNGVEYGAFLTQDVEVELRGLPCRNTEEFSMPSTNWAVAERGVDGVIMMLPADNPQSFLEAHQMFDHIQQQLDVPFLLAVTRNDEGLMWEKEELSDCFHVPQDFIVYLDPRNYSDAFSTLNYLFEYAPVMTTAPASAEETVSAEETEPAYAMHIA